MKENLYLCHINVILNNISSSSTRFTSFMLYQIVSYSKSSNLIMLCCFPGEEKEVFISFIYWIVGSLIHLGCYGICSGCEGGQMLLVDFVY